MTAYITFLGAPGSGKGTQADKVKNILNIESLGIGDRMRHEIARGSVLGDKIDGFVKKGLLVPDDIVIDVVRNGVSVDMFKKGFIADGFPRNLIQAIAYDRFLSNKDLRTIVIYIEVPLNKLKERLLGRGREDDIPEIIDNRNRVYLEQTKPILKYFSDRLITINGDQDPESVLEDICTVINKEKISLNK